jgi:hypothetical protein
MSMQALKKEKGIISGTHDAFSFWGLNFGCLKLVSGRHEGI